MILNKNCERSFFVTFKPQYTTVTWILVFKDHKLCISYHPHLLAWVNTFPKGFLVSFHLGHIFKSFRKPERRGLFKLGKRRKIRLQPDCKSNNTEKENFGKSYFDPRVSGSSRVRRPPITGTEIEIWDKRRKKYDFFCDDCLINIHLPLTPWHRKAWRRQWRLGDRGRCKGQGWLHQS